MQNGYNIECDHGCELEVSPRDGIAGMNQKAGEHAVENIGHQVMTAWVLMKTFKYKTQEEEAAE